MSGSAAVPYTQADVDALKAKIAAAGNTQRVQYSDGAGVTYRSHDDALKLLALMQADVRANTPVDATTFETTPVRGFRVVVSSGY
jgi:hypothetical protein